MKAPNRMYDGQILTVDGIDFLISLSPDQDAPPPWENGGYYPLNMRTARRSENAEYAWKSPSETYLGETLVSGHPMSVFYRVSDAVRYFRKEGYTGKQAYDAARQDIELLQGWFRGTWEYVTVKAHALDDQGDILPLSASLSGVEYDPDDGYALYVAEMLARQVIAEHSGMFSADMPRLEDVIDPDELLDPADLDFDMDYAIAA